MADSPNQNLHILLIHIIELKGRHHLLLHRAFTLETGWSG